MAAPALDVRAVDAALWEAAKEGNAAEARRLLDEGARVEWKKASKVSSWCHGWCPHVAAPID